MAAVFSVVKQMAFARLRQTIAEMSWLVSMLGCCLAWVMAGVS